jgi:membrane-associated phospholipid phosphatase
MQRLKWTESLLGRLILWAGLLGLVLGLGLLAAKFPVLPGDVALARLMQTVVGESTGWAYTITNTAKAPWAYVLVALTAGIGWRLRGPWTAGAAIIACLLAHGFDRLLKPLIGRPRPSPELIEVAGSTAGFSCPSTFALVYAATFALVYAATFGFLLCVLCRQPRSGWRNAGLVCCALALLLGASARVVLGGHWPSDLLISFLLGALFIVPLALVQRSKSRGWNCFGNEG